MNHSHENQLLGSIEIWLSHAERYDREGKRDKIPQAYWEAYHHAIELQKKLRFRYIATKEEVRQHD
jgi:hypothetical protein